MEDDITQQVKQRIQSLLLNNEIPNYREHESFRSQSNQNYQFLIWKLQPENWDQFSGEMQQLVENKGYQFIPGACDVTTYNPATKTGYKVIALYKPNKN
jgi:hypothetical protein